MNVTIPVSIGELVDKYTILQIKESVLDEEKKIQVKKEMDALEPYISPLRKDYNMYLLELEKVNRKIFFDQDTFRNVPESVNAKNIRGDLALKIIKDNDSRFRLKNKINILSNSVLKEQKGYKPKKAFIFPHIGCGDMFTFISAIRYLSFFVYDEIQIVVNLKFLQTAKQIYSDDPSISFYPISNVHLLSPQFGNKSMNRKIILDHCTKEDMTPLLIGMHSFDFNHDWAKFTAYPFYRKFYEELNVPFTVFNELTYFNRNPEKELEVFRKAIPEAYRENYIFVHNVNVLSLPIEQTSNEPFLYDPNKQITFKYEWSGVLSNNLIDYSLLLENASEIHIMDSSFSCLARILSLPSFSARTSKGLKATKKVIYARKGNFYPDYFGSDWTIVYTDEKLL